METGMRTIASVVLGLLLLVAAGCGSAKPKDAIIGKWDVVSGNDKLTGTKVEFTKEGEQTSATGSFVVKTKYRFSQDDILESEFDFGNLKVVQKFKVEIKGDDMTMTEQDGAKSVKKYKRSK
jgi:hypothetical protein